MSDELDVVETGSDRDATGRAAAYTASQQFGFGDTIPRSWLDEQFGLERADGLDFDEHTRRNLEFFAAFMLFSKELLVSHKMALKSIGRGEWLIVQPNEQHAFALQKLMSTVTKALRQAALTIEHTRVDLLSSEEARARTDAMNRIAALEAFAKRKIGGASTPKFEPNTENEDTSS